MENKEEEIELKTLSHCKSQGGGVFDWFLFDYRRQEDYKELSSPRGLAELGFLHFLCCAGLLCSVHHGDNRVSAKASPCGTL